MEITLNQNGRSFVGLHWLIKNGDGDGDGAKSLGEIVAYLSLLAICDIMSRDDDNVNHLLFIIALAKHGKDVKNPSRKHTTKQSQNVKEICSDQGLIIRQNHINFAPSPSPKTKSSNGCEKDIVSCHLSNAGIYMQQFSRDNHQLAQETWDGLSSSIREVWVHASLSRLYIAEHNVLQTIKHIE